MFREPHNNKKSAVLIGKKNIPHSLTGGLLPRFGQFKNLQSLGCVLPGALLDQISFNYRRDEQTAPNFP